MINEKRAELIEWARTNMLGVRWVHQGRSLKTGVDCGGTVQLPAWHFGYGDPATGDLKGYSRHPDGHSLLTNLAKQCDEVDPNKMQPGDILLFCYIDSTWPSHLALLTEKNGIPYMLHAWAASSAKKVCETVYDDFWKSKLVAVYAYRGIDE